MAKLDVRNFSNIFDKGITDYAKFNWLSDGLPDGEYNGITKVTIKSVSKITKSGIYHWGTYSIAESVPGFNGGFIYPTDTTETFAYGFSNWKIWNSAQVEKQSFNAISISSAVSVLVSIPSIPSNEATVEKYNEYLEKNPVIIYYYGRNKWSGAMITASSIGGAASYLITNIGGGLGEVRDVKGDFKYITGVNSENWTDVYNSKDTIPSIFRINSTQYTDNIYVDDGNFNPPSNAANRTNFINKYFSEPRAIVYKK